MKAALVAAAVITRPWAAHDMRLTVVTVIGIAIIVVLIVPLNVHPFLSLILGAAFVGLAAAVPLAMIVTNFEDGVGSTLKEVGLLIALGAMLGKLLADSGGADRAPTCPSSCWVTWWPLHCASPPARPRWRPLPRQGSSRRRRAA